jgi:hypothetical protein
VFLINLLAAGLVRCWQLLAALVSQAGPLLQSSTINANICSAATAACSAAASSSSSLVDSLVTLFGVLSSSSSSSSSSRGCRCPVSVIHSFRPSLEQQAALLAAALTQLWQQQQQQQQLDPGTAAAADGWAMLCAVLLHWFNSTAVMHTNAKKVGLRKQCVIPKPE